jgi:hypothetical protein
MSDAPICKLSHSIAADFSQGVVVSALRAFYKRIKQCFNFRELINLVPGEPADYLEEKRFEELSRYLLNFSCKLYDDRE